MLNSISTRLNDAAVTTFDNTGLPFGPEDFAGGFQWDLPLGIGESATVDAFIACGQAAMPVTQQHFQVD